MMIDGISHYSHGHIRQTAQEIHLLLPPLPLLHSRSGGDDRHLVGLVIGLGLGEQRRRRRDGGGGGRGKGWMRINWSGMRKSRCRQLPLLLLREVVVVAVVVVVVVVEGED